jgi:predicted nucleic acid-binding protein
MQRDNPSVVLDTHALLSHLFDEPGAVAVEATLAAARQGECGVLVSGVSVGEVCYLMERRQGIEAVAAVLAALEDLPLQVVDVDRGAILGAAHVKARHPISFADAFVVTLAIEESATVLTGDPEFKRVEHLVPVRWLTS